jgi:hypothetical protein
LRTDHHGRLGFKASAPDLLPFWLSRQLSVLSVIICSMSNGAPISITLSPAQVDQVVRAAAQGSAPSFSALISTTLNAQWLANDGGIDDSPVGSADAVVPAAGSAQQNGEPAVDATSYFPTYHDTRLSRSLLRGLSILTCFGPDNGERGIIELAGQLGMSPSTTHRYVATLVELGLLERSARTRKYRLARIPDGLAQLPDGAQGSNGEQGSDEAQGAEDPLLGEHRGTSVAQPALDD